MRILFSMMLAAALAAVAAGCASERGKEKLAMGAPPQERYEPLSGYYLTLRTEPRQIIHVGEGGRITFALRNMDKKKSIRITEWFSNESDNVIVSCQPWLTGMGAPDEKAWTELSFDVKLPPWRYPLELMPGNQVLVTKTLPFVDKLAVSPGAERRFFLRARLNLKSVSVSSPVSVLIVRPARPKAVKAAGAGAKTANDSRKGGQDVH